MADGSFFAIWRSDGQDGDGQGLYGRHFDASGNALSDEIPITTTTSGNQFDPEVTQLASGELLITWTSDYGTDSDVYSTTLDLSGNSVSEGAANGTVVGQAVATDIDTSDTLTYSLVNDGGGRFAIDGNTGTITVADSSLLDFETATSHTVRVRVVDAGGLSSEQDIAITVANANEAPTSSDNTLTLDEDASHTFTATEFGFSDVDAGDSLSTIKITQLPGAGSLTLSGTAVTANQVITAADIPNLVFTPAANANGAGYADFKFTVSDGSLESAAQTITLNVDAVNDAPEASDNTVTLDEDDSHTFSASEFGFSDIDAGDTLQSIKITQLPAAGTLTLNGVAVTANQVIDTDDIPNLLFTPAANANGTGYASFQFTVTDSGGMVSAAQTITLNVDAVNDAPVLDADLDPIVNTEARVNSAVTTGDQYEAHSDSTANGAITVWHSEEGGSHVIRARLPDGSEVQINETAPTGTQYVRTPEVAVLDNGNYAVIWDLFTPGVSVQSHMRVFDQNGTEIKSEFTLGGYHQYQTKLVALSGNQFATAYYDSSDSFKVHVKIYNASGTQTSDIVVGSVGGWNSGSQDIVALIMVDLRLPGGAMALAAIQLLSESMTPVARVLPDPSVMVMPPLPISKMSILKCLTAVSC